MRERVTASFAVVGTVTAEQRETLENLLGSMREISETAVTLWSRPSLNRSHKSDGVAVAGTVEAEDEFDAIVNFCNLVRAALDAIHWRLDVALLEAEVVRIVPRPGTTAAVPAQRDELEAGDGGRIEDFGYAAVAA